VFGRLVGKDSHPIGSAVVQRGIDLGQACIELPDSRSGFGDMGSTPLLVFGQVGESVP
jgi:hypothetical protein